MLEFNSSDPRLDLSDPRVISFDGQDYLTTLSHLRLLVSSDGVHFAEPEHNQPLMGIGELETYGIEDCRVAQIGDDLLSDLHASLQQWCRRGIEDDPRLEELCPGRHDLCSAQQGLCALRRTDRGQILCAASTQQPGAWRQLYLAGRVARPYSLGQHRCLAHSREGYWDSARVGAGAAPIRTADGWLEIYHGATKENRYCLGALLLDLDEPWRVLARSETPIMEPFAPYEQEGFFGHVIFTNGHVVDADCITIYYGAADSVICAARLSISSILASLCITQGARA